jgi:hypothetical protein
MSTKKHIIALNDQERAQLEQIAHSNRRSIREKTRARILLLTDTSRSRQEGANRNDSEVASSLRCTAWTVSQVRRRACERGVLQVVSHQEQSKRKARKLDGRQEAQLVALTCSTPPKGHARWSLVLLRERLIGMEVVEQIGLETIRTTLKKMHSSHG